MRPRRSPMKRTTQLRNRSKKRAQRYRKERVPIVRIVLARYPICQRCSAARSTEVHEPLLRSRGGDPFEIAQCVALCRACHQHIHANPAEATADGWMRHAWDPA